MTIVHDLELDLREAKEYLENLIDTANVIAVELDLGGRVVRFNQAAEEITGYSFEEVRAGNWFELLVPKHRYPEAWEEFHRLRAEGVSRHSENPVLTKDGQERFVSWRNSVVRRGGDIVGTLSFGVDITEQRQAECGLRESENSYRTLLENTPDVVMRFDRAGKHLYVNPRVSSVVPFQPSDFIGKAHRELGFSPEQSAFWEEHIQAVFDTGKPFETEFEFEGIGGPVVFNWRLVPVHGEKGIDSVLSLARDVTEQRRLEKDYRVLFEEMLDGFALHEMILDGDGRPVDYRFLAVNPAFEKLTGLKGTDLVGQTVLEVMPNIEKTWIERYGAVAQQGEATYFESYSAELNKHFEVTAFSPKPGQFACIFKDVTARKALEEQYLHAQKMEAVGRLAGGVAHDLNNLLTPILGYADMLLEDCAGNDNAVHEATEIFRAGNRAKDLVRQLLAFSRKQTLELSPVDLGATVRGFERLLRRTLREDVKLESRLVNPSPFVQGDVGQIEQVIMNLAINAQDAMPHGGIFRMETRVDCEVNQECIICKEVPSGRFAVLEISDTGCGMDEATLSRAFEPFFTTKEVGQGTGLGLAMVQGIVDQHSGHLVPRSEPSQGTTISIYLPLAESQHSNATATGYPEGPIPRTATGQVIMVVEDEELVRDLAAGVLERQGYKVLRASCGKDCLHMLEGYSGPLDLLLTDVIMPELNGRALYELIRERFPQAAALYMSGYSHEVISHSGVLDPGVEFIAKPFKLRDLCDRIAQILSR